MIRFCGFAISLLQVAALAGQDREAELLQRIHDLEQRLAAVEARLGVSPAAPAAAPAASAPPPSSTAAGNGLPAGTTVSVLLDGYYEYNFNRPAGRVNAARVFDPSSNSFTLNQAAVVLERAADPAAGRRFGARLDLMFGQATDSLSGNPANEPRTSPYRNIFQAYGTYVVPLGKGLNVDFGRYASSLGMEGAFAKDQLNYSRSLLFAALPFYHMGFRTSYKLSDRLTATWALVNGLNQTEDFNGFKSNHFMLTAAPSKNVSWTASYYVGRESRDTTPVADGRTHIADTYASWNATPKLTLAGEGDYIVTRLYGNSAPGHLAGGAGYARYQFTPAFSLAGRWEYVSDRAGLIGTPAQAIKEGTFTATYQPAEGFQIRWEFRHDYSNQAFFATRTPGVLRSQQNTALLGLLWWFGGKQGSW